MKAVTDGLTETQTWDVLVAMTRLDRARQLVDSHADLVMAQRRLLWLLMDREGHTMREIGDALRLEQSTVNRQVNAAIEAGLLERVKSERTTAHSLVVTERGLASLAADVTQHARLHEAALSTIPEDRVAEFVELFALFATAYRDAVDAEVDQVT